MGTLSAPALQARNAFASKVKPGADEAIRKNQATYQPALELAIAVDAAIAKKQPATIQVHITQVRALTDRVQKEIEALDAAIAKIKEFALANKGVLAELPEVAGLTAQVADERRKAATRIPMLKAALAKAEAALKGIASSKTELNAQWLAIESAARKALEEVLADLKTITGHRDKARTANKGKDAKALADAKGKAEMMPNPHLSDWPKGMQRKLADFANRYEKQPKVDKLVLDQLARDKADLNSVLERIALNAKLIESIRREVSGLK